MGEPSLSCYRCGYSLAELSLPLRRLETCPDCGIELHVCRMCQHYRTGIPKQCGEDDAEEVREKTRANFCDFFKPAAGRYDPGIEEASSAARSQLDDLFGTTEGAPAGEEEPPGADQLKQAEDLFR